MWLELTRHGTSEAVWVNTDTVTYILELTDPAGQPGSKLFFAGGTELAVKEALDRIIERMQLA